MFLNISSMLFRITVGTVWLYYDVNAVTLHPAINIENQPNRRERYCYSFAQSNSHMLSKQMVGMSKESRLLPIQCTQDLFPATCNNIFL